MGKDMTFWLFIGMFRGLVDVTRAFRKIEDAKKAFQDYTKHDWDEVTADEKICEKLHSGDFFGSQIEELQIEP